MLQYGLPRGELKLATADFQINSEDFRPSFDQLDWDWTAGRRMCAGTYLDAEFRDRLLREVYNARTRRTAPSYGYDVAPVLAHAWRAWRLEMVQHVLTLLVFSLVLLAFPLDAVLAASSLAVAYFVHRVARLVRDYAAYYRGLDSALEIERLRTRRKLITYGMLTSCLALVAAVLGILHSDHYKGGPPPWPEEGSLTGTLILLAVIALVVAGTAAARQYRVNRLHKAGLYFRHPWVGRLATIEAQQYHPFAVYSGFEPFVGSGVNIRTWSFAQRLVHADATGEGTEEYGEDELPFSSAELIDSLRKMITGLAADANPETMLRGLIVTDRVFLEGTHAIPYMQVLQSEPGSLEVAHAIDHVIANSSDAARHYLACQVASWGGEVVTSIFVHVSLQGRTLYLEYCVYALPPTRTDYQAIDEVGATGPASIARAVGKSIFTLPDTVIAPGRLAHGLTDLLGALRATKDGTRTVRRRSNIGARVSARELACGDAAESYFQLRDIVQHFKIIERRLIATVGEFLDDCGADTSEFWQRATTILNQGIINAGPGTINFNADVSVNQGSAPPAPDAPPGS